MQKTYELLVLPTIGNIDEIINGMSKSIALTKGSYKNLEFKFERNNISFTHNGIDIKNFSNVWLSSYWPTRDLAYAVKLYLEHFETPYTYVEKATSKLTDQVIFAFNNISIPNTFFIDNNDISKYIDEIERICSYPLIIKDVQGSGGRFSLLVKNRTELIEKSASLPENKKFFYQEFIPNDYDWGILVSNGKVLSGERSFPNINEFRNNCHGATEHFENVELIPDHIKKMAIQAADALGLSWSRSDIVINNDSNIAYLMEVNRCPGITSGSMEVLGAQSFLDSHLKQNSITTINIKQPIVIYTKLEEVPVSLP